MYTENILDQTQPQKSEFANCKIKYLLAQNKLMTHQLSSVCLLVEKYKKIIDILSINRDEGREGQKEGSKGSIEEKETKLNQEEKQVNQESKKHAEQYSNNQIKKILKEAENVIQKCVIECKQLSNTKNIFQDEEGTITPAFFSQLVLSYEKTIAELKQNIHHREILLQELETTPKHPMKRNQQQTQSSTIIKAIQSYDIYPRLSEKCRKQILQLKQKKKELEMKNSRQGNKLKNSTSLNTLNQFDKTIKKVPQYVNAPNNEINFDEKTKIQAQAMSPFQKTILIYKKKKIFNDILQAKVIDLKKKIKEKELCNQILRKRLENEVWNNIQNMNHYGRNLDEDDPAYLSMLNQSIRANNLDFSVDISKVITGGQGKQEHPVNLENILQQIGKETERE